MKVKMPETMLRRKKGTFSGSTDRFIVRVTGESVMRRSGYRSSSSNTRARVIAMGFAMSEAAKRVKQPVNQARLLLVSAAVA
jgi:hypothetical protein